MSLKHLSKPVECTTPRVNSNGNGRLWVTMMCRCRFISCNNCTTLVGDIDNGRGYACVGVECMWETSIPSSQFCSGPKTAIKKKKSYLFIYLFMTVLSLLCCAQAFSSCGEPGLLFIVVHGLLIAMASLIVEHGL